MPDYLIIETTGAQKLEDGNRRVVRNAATPQEAVAVVLIKSGFQPDQEFMTFRISQGVKVPVEQSRTVTALDGANPLTVLATYDEAALEALKASRGG